LVFAPLLAPGLRGGTSEVLGILVVVAYAGHVAVTGWLWTVPDVRETVRNQPVRLVALPVVLVTSAVGIAMLVRGHLFSWLLLGFFAWQFSHFQRQNLGLAKLIAAKWAAEPMGNVECGIAMIAGWCGIAALMTRPALLGLPRLDVASVETGFAFRFAALVYATCVIAAVFVALTVRRPVSVSASCLICVLFMTPVFLFHNPQGAVTGLVVAHGLRYLWIVRWRSRQASIAASSAGWLGSVAVIAGAVLGGCLLEAMSELHSAQHVVSRVLYGAYFGVVMGHFSVDTVVWRRPTRRIVTSHRRGALLPSPAYGRL
jgi:hypothetical protein